MKYTFYNGETLMTPDFVEKDEAALVKEFGILRASTRSRAVIKVGDGVLYAISTLSMALETHNVDQSAFTDQTTPAEKLAALNARLDEIEAERQAQSTGTTVYSSDPLLAAKQRKMEELEAQDESTNVCYINGTSLWLDKGTRTSLIANTIPALEAAGQTTVTLWSQGDNPQSFDLPIGIAKQALGALELYALQTYSATAQHKANIAALYTVDAVEDYDVTANYPNPLTFDL